MTALLDALGVFKSATYWASTGKLGKGFGVAYPDDAGKVEAYARQLAAGDYATSPPAVATKHAQGIVGMLAALAAAIPRPPAPPSTQPAGWDATKLAVSPDSAKLIAGFVPAAFGGMAAYATMVIARSVNDATAVPYAVTGGSSDRTVYLKPGTRPSLSDDHHLLVIDPARNRQHDLWAAVIDHVAKTIKVGGGTSQPLDSVQEPKPGSSNAARLALEAFTVKLDEAKAGVIPHAVGFSMKNTMIGGPSVYPANDVTSGPGTNLVFGQLLRFPPSRDFAGLGLPKLDLAICNAIRDHGMVLADGGSNVAFWCEDPQDEGGNQAWIDAGFPVPNLVNGYPYAAAMSGKIPWAELQVCLPPA